MKLPLKRPSFLKLGIAAFLVTLAGVNYAQMNGNSKSFSVIKVTDAKAALNCTSAPSKTCSGTTSDGVPHTVTNAENS